MKRLTARGDGGVALSFAANEVEVLRGLAGQLDALVSGDEQEPGADPVRDRLFPRAYLDPTAEPEEEEFQSAVHGELVQGKSEAAAAVVASLDGAAAGRRGTVTVTLDREGVEVWVGALNDIRLALGVTLGVTEEMSPVPADDPRAAGLDLYQWLTWLQGSLVEVLS